MKPAGSVRGLTVAMGVGLLAISATASAGLFELTGFSRANCINHESITWDAASAATGSIWLMQTRSYITNTDTMEVTTEIASAMWTVRSAAICVGCALQFPAVVEGEHFVLPHRYGANFEEAYNYLQENCDPSEGGTFDFGSTESVIEHAMCWRTHASSCNMDQW